MKRFRIAFILLMLSLLTAGYSQFIETSARLSAIFIAESNPNPGLLYDLTVRPYVVWIVLASVSFTVNAVWIIMAFRKNTDTNVYVPASIMHMLLIFVCLSWNVVGLVSSLICKVHVLK